MHRTLSFVLLAAACAAPAAAQVRFYSLGVLPEASSSETVAVSADGNVVLGFIRADTGFQIIRWTAEGGSEHIVAPPEFRGGAIGSGLTADGSMIVGNGSVNNRGTGFSWTRDAGFLLHPGRSFHGVSDDGNYLFGNQDIVGRPFRWSENAGAEYLGDSGTTIRASADGSVIIGNGGGTAGYSWRWTASDGQTSLDEIPDGFNYSVADGISPDGSIVVGFLSDDDNPASRPRAFRWTIADGFELLADIESARALRGTDISADGRTIVGSAYFDQDERAAIWTPDGEVHLFADYLAMLGVSLDGWTLLNANSISDDGLTIAGNGVNPDGITEGWVVRIPTPSGALALVLFLRPVRRRR